MEENISSKEVINNEYDFSNIIVDLDHILYLVRYLDSLNKQLEKLVEEDEEKNKQFKDEYREYTYKKMYNQGLNIYVKYETYSNNITCKDYETFSSAARNGSIKNIRGMDIELSMNFKRGKGNNLVEHENSFKIKFEPYNITFIRKSYYNDESMDAIEKQIVAILSQFPAVNTIFCSK